MKKVLVLFVCVSLLWACNNSNNSTGNRNASDHAEHATDSMDHPKAGDHGLTLNNGKKWDSDESTNSNVTELKTILTRFNEKQNKSAADYSAAGTELQAGLDKLVKECRMKGPDHDALHAWLEPVMKDVNALKKAANENEASGFYTRIEERVSLYNQYFE